MAHDNYHALVVSDHSTFQTGRPLFSSGKASRTGVDDLYDFITFLAVAQKLEIDILPITWQSTREMIGLGGTSQINQSSINVRTSFAFKCVGDRHKLDKPMHSIYQSIISEVIALRVPSIQRHSNILELQGICWDIPLSEDSETEAGEGNPPSQYKVWPVLVFEKSEFGDLHNFAMLPVGRDLGFNERLQLCEDIGTAVADMHSKHFIHGDIKPQNVLIFKSTTGGFTAKVTDFGYSTQYLDEEDDIELPQSRPWDAPEFHHWVKPAQARKMDVFSFGMLCLWLLFEKYFSGIKQLPADANWVQGKLKMPQILEELKRTKTLVQFANQLLMAEEEFVAEQKQRLESFFNGSLCDYASRDIGVMKLFHHLDFHGIRLSGVELPEEQLQPSECEFEISRSVLSFYHSDYRVRSYIANCLEGRVSTSPTSGLVVQLAVCFKIGFGCLRSDERSHQLLHESEASEILLAEAIDEIKEPKSTAVPGILYQRLREMGHIWDLNTYDYYLERDLVNMAESIIRGEVEDLGRILGFHSSVVRLLKSILASIVFKQGRINEAEKLLVEVVESMEIALGPDHPDTLASIGFLVSVYREQGRWKESEEANLAVLETWKRLFGSKHPWTLRSISSLVSTYWKQGRLNEAEQLQSELLATQRSELGYEHLITLNTNSDLASIYLKQGRWKEAEEQFSQLLKATTRLLGPLHPDTLKTAGNLASTYRNQRKLKESEKLHLETMEKFKTVLGPEHPDTLTQMSNVALTYLRQEKFSEAEELMEQVMETRKRILGPKHPSTLTSISNLASMYQQQDRLELAEGLLLQVVETWTTIFGQENPSTLASMDNLAATYTKQGRLKEGGDLFLQVIKSSKKALGLKHLSTLSAMQNLVSIYLKEGRKEEAGILLLEVVEISEEVLGPEHTDTLRDKNSLASIHYNEGRWKEAEKLQMDVLKALTKLPKLIKHPSTLQMVHDLAWTRKSQGRDDEAITLMRSGVELMVEALGSEHQLTKASVRDLKTWTDSIA